MKTKSDEEKYCTVSLLCEILGQKQKRSHRYREQIGGGQRWGMQGGRRERRGSKVQTSSIAYMKAAKKVALQNSHCKNKVFKTMVW